MQYYGLRYVVVLLAGSKHGLDHFAAECEATGMKISKSEVIYPSGEETLTLVEDFKHLGILFMSD